MLRCGMRKIHLARLPGADREANAGKRRPGEHSPHPAMEDAHSYNEFRFGGQAGPHGEWKMKI